MKQKFWIGVINILLVRIYKYKIKIEIWLHLFKGGKKIDYSLYFLIMLYYILYKFLELFSKLFSKLLSHSSLSKCPVIFVVMIIIRVLEPRFAVHIATLMYAELVVRLIFYLRRHQNV